MSAGYASPRFRSGVVTGTGNGEQFEGIGFESDFRAEHRSNGVEPEEGEEGAQESKRGCGLRALSCMTGREVNGAREACCCD